MKEKTRNTSARIKLVPAVAMLTTSAIMLSSATYAWFTLNKEVQVTGLSMSATASEGLEISLGSLASVGANPTAISAPGKDDVSWKRSIQFSDYYKSVTKLMPASSNTALTLYTVDDKKVFAGGHDVEEGATVSALAKDQMSILTLQDAASGKTFTVDEDGDAGYYLDVPMWIRSSNNDDTEIECTVTITDGTTYDPAEDLMKAVRVAIIPVYSDDNSADLAGDTKYKAQDTGANTYALDAGSKVTDSETGVIFGLKAPKGDLGDYPTYNGKVISSAATYSDASLGTVTVNEAAAALIDNSKFDGTNDASNTPATTVFTIPGAAENDFAGVSFIARIWIEGESVYCEDATADQDWQIDFNFKIPTTVASGT